MSDATNVTIHGYDDAVAGRTGIYKASAHWGTEELRDITKLRTPGELGRFLYVRGVDFDEGVEYREPVEALARRVHRAHRESLRAAPLVYLTPGILERFDDISPVAPDVHALPFAETTLLWFSVALPGDWFHGDKGVSIRTPVRAALVRPDPSGDGAIYYHTYFGSRDLVDAGFRVPVTGHEGELSEQAVIDAIEETHFGRWHGDVTGRVTAGRDANKVSKAAGVIARALNAMSVREARMAEDETDVKRTRKEAKRAGVTNPGAIHVVYLPRERKPGSSYVPDDTDAHGNPRRRHQVRAHWRRQPYGPRGAGQWRWTRIEAHERGTGARLAGETVYAARPPRKEHGK